jgi:hypothetical protein
VAKYFKISIGELPSLSADGLQSQTKETEIRVGGSGASIGWDDVETDQVVAIATRTTIAAAAMILRMKTFLRGSVNRHLRCQGGYAWADSSDVTAVTECSLAAVRHTIFIFDALPAGLCHVTKM